MNDDLLSFILVLYVFFHLVRLLRACQSVSIVSLLSCLTTKIAVTLCVVYHKNTIGKAVVLARYFVVVHPR